MKKILWTVFLLVIIIVFSAQAETLKLPANLKVVGKEAFMNMKADSIVLPEGIERIESKAFAKSKATTIVLPSTLDFIADDAFDGSALISVEAAQGSYAYEWAVKNGYIYSPASDFEYYISNGGCTITYYSGTSSYVIVPETIEGFPVTGIEGDRAFFSYTRKVKSITLPRYIENIDLDVFRSPRAPGDLYEINVNKDNNLYSSIDGVLFNKNATKILVYPERKTGDKYIIPNTVVTIGKYAFDGCRYLSSIDIPNSVRTIEKGAFSGCEISEICIPDTVENIDFNSLFSGCQALESMEIPDCVTIVGREAFHNCINLVNVKISDNVTLIDDYAFAGCRSLVGLSIPSSVTVIGEWAFDNCGLLSELVLPDFLLNIGDFAFYECVGLTKIAIPNRVNKIGSGAFGNCVKLNHVVLPSSLTTICNQVFSGCTNLEYIRIPNSVRNIDFGVFDYCDHLKQVYIPESVVDIDGYIFYDCNSINIVGMPGSYAENYANEYSIPFISYRLTLNVGAAALKPGDTLQLTASTQPDGAAISDAIWASYNTQAAIVDNGLVNGIEQRVVWSSENEKVAIVDESGLVTALSEGICKIVATKAENSAVFSYCVITVTDDNEFEAFEQFGNRCLELEKNYEGYRSDALDYPDFGIGRLMVETTDSLPDISGFNPDIILQDGDFFFIIQFSSAKEAYDCTAYLESYKVTKSVEPDQYVEVQASSFSSQNAQPEYLGWGISAIHADEYQKDLIRRGRTGTVIVAVMDTGLNSNHEIFNGRICGAKDFVKPWYLNPGEEIIDVSKRESITDEDGHGTHVAGIIAGCTQGINVKIMPIRIIEHTNDTIPKMRIRNAFEYIFKMNANIINISLEVEVQKTIYIFGQEINSSTPQHNVFDKYIKIACQDKEISVIVAAGNSATDTSNICPAHLSECITVTAIERSGKLWSKSNFGDSVDICAPGSFISSAWIDASNGYKLSSGTSMAAPHVSAAVAMLLLDYPDASPAELKIRLYNAATNMGDSKYYGFGMLNLRDFIKGLNDIGALSFNGHYYYLYNPREVLTWSQAESYCEARGGHLATINTQEEDEFIYTQIMKPSNKDGAYFGLTDIYSTGVWKWVTGEDVNYLNWKDGEPNNYDGEEHYGMYYWKNTNGEWNDGSFINAPSLSERAFICEWD